MTKNIFKRPDWVPCVPVGMRVLITGATGGLGRALVRMLLKGSTCMIGAHGSSQVLEMEEDRIIPLPKLSAMRTHAANWLMTTLNNLEE